LKKTSISKIPKPQLKKRVKMPIDISKFDGCHILVVGDLMIDEYLWGDVDRISPEAPVQVVAVRNEEFTLGGAGNVVANLLGLGAKVSVVAVAGTDGNSKTLLKKLGDLGIDTAGIIRERTRPTTKKTRIIADHQQVLRIDRETVHPVTTKTFEAVAKSAEAIMPTVDVVVISDYGKGLVTRQLIERLTVAAEKYGKITIADPKGLDFTKYNGTHLITPNKKEASLAAGIEIVDDATLFEAGRRILQKTGVAKLVITCGKEGMACFESDMQPQKISTQARQVYDVTGAGDTVVAVIALAIASGSSFMQAVMLANTAAGIVVGQVGTAAISKKELAAALNLIGDDVVSKQIGLGNLARLALDLRKKGRRIVLTNGCFDLLHVGHIKLLSASKQMGDVLLVAIDDDDSVRRLKGPQRPVIGAGERLRIISALDSVDYVVLFSSGQLGRVIEAVRPDVLTKGSDYRSEEVFGREIVERHGGRVELIPITAGISSTQIINTIKNR
jgi:D-beta-D-heptose 7-phosphate kinase/D-beta-D-heptose 1-phosphate adenosyltransferase